MLCAGCKTVHVVEASSREKEVKVQMTTTERS